MNSNRCLLYLLLVAVLCGCAKVEVPPPAKDVTPQVVQPPVVEPGPPPQMPPEVPQSVAEELDHDYMADDPPKPYYAAQANLPLYPRARFTEPVCFIPLNEKLLRYKIHRGFAFVKVEATGQTGWVDNAKLDWRRVTPMAPEMRPEVIAEPEPPMMEVAPKPLPEPQPATKLKRTYPVPPPPANGNQPSIEVNF